MKLYSTLILLSLALVQSCKKDDARPDPENAITVKMNNVNWEGTSEIRFNATTPDTLVVLGIRSTVASNAEFVGFKIKFTGQGKYVVSGRQAFYYTLSGGDIMTPTYFLAANTTGEVDVTAYDSATKKLSGTFRFTLRQNTHELAFTEGRFKGQIAN